MKIEWKRVTWYSQIVAIILFVGVFVLGMYLGMHLQMEQDKATQAVTTTSADPNRPITIATFKCDAGKEIQAAFYKNYVQLTFNDGRSITLPQAMSADGARYANTDKLVVFWNVGQTATLTEGSSTTYANCKQIAAPVNQ